MVAATRADVGTKLTSGAIGWPSFIETLLALAAVASLLIPFQRLAADDIGRGGRFADTAISVSGLPERVLPSLCALYGALAEPAVRERLCRRSELRAAGEPPTAIPSFVAEAFAQASRAFRRPLAAAEQRRADLRVQQREGLGDLLALDHAIESIDAELQPYIERYAMGVRDAGPLPLACSFEMAGSALARPSERGAAAQANAVLLLGAALDGHGATAALAASALLPSYRREANCENVTFVDALSAAAALMADARQARIHAAKNEAMRNLLHTAGWQWAAWMVLGLVLVKWSRRRDATLFGVAAALAAWALAAWLGRVPWPFAVDRAFEAGPQGNAWLAPPAPYVIALFAAAALVALLAIAIRRPLPSPPQTLTSRIGYPGLVMATGIGWMILLDLSANGHFSNRYLGLYHHGHLWLGMLALTLVAFVRQPLGRALAWVLSMLDALIARLRHWAGTLPMTVAALLLAIGLIIGVGATLATTQQITSELARLWIIIGASWFFFLRGDPLLRRLARSGSSVTSLLRYIGPLLFVALVLVGIQVVSRYMGPLLIASYGAGAFVAAAIAMWWHERSGAYRGAFVLAMVLFVAWIIGITSALFELGPLHEVTAGRLENLAAPLASANDQLALVTWFQKAAPPDGYGVGAVPWCGNTSGTGCPGVPLQIQSDYTLTALVGVFGWTLSWGVVIGCAIWLHRLIRSHGRVTPGEPRLVSTAGRMSNDAQALLSWMAVAWVVLTLCQLAVTVAGNLAVLPLTGVTFPFVSYGMTSLVVNMAMLGIAINVTVTRWHAHG